MNETLVRIPLSTGSVNRLIFHHYSSVYSRWKRVTIIRAITKTGSIRIIHHFQHFFSLFFRCSRRCFVLRTVWTKITFVSRNRSSKYSRCSIRTNECLVLSFSIYPRRKSIISIEPILLSVQKFTLDISIKRKKVPMAK